MSKYKVICISPRQIADDVYAINQEYIVDEVRLNKYKSNFRILEKIADKAKAPTAKANQAEAKKAQATEAKAKEARAKEARAEEAKAEKARAKQAKNVENKNAGKIEDK